VFSSKYIQASFQQWAELSDQDVGHNLMSAVKLTEHDIIKVMLK
jgi:hypothetical protein